MIASVVIVMLAIVALTLLFSYESEVLLLAVSLFATMFTCSLIPCRLGAVGAVLPAISRSAHMFELTLVLKSAPSMFLEEVADFSLRSTRSLVRPCV